MATGPSRRSWPGRQRVSGLGDARTSAMIARSSSWSPPAMSHALRALDRTTRQGAITWPLRSSHGGGGGRPRRGAAVLRARTQAGEGAACEGARRCAGGSAGAPFDRRVAAAAAARRRPTEGTSVARVQIVGEPDEVEIVREAAPDSGLGASGRLPTGASQHPLPSGGALERWGKLPPLPGSVVHRHAAVYDPVHSVPASRTSTASRQPQLSCGADAFHKPQFLTKGLHSTTRHPCWRRPAFPLEAMFNPPRRTCWNGRHAGQDTEDWPTFVELGLSEWLAGNCAEMGIKRPSAVQRNCIPPILAGKDVLGTAETGSGKTAAFALPILQALAQDPYGAPLRDFSLLRRRCAATTACEICSGKTRGVGSWRPQRKVRVPQRCHSPKPARPPLQFTPRLTRLTTASARLAAANSR